MDNQPTTGKEALEEIRKKLGIDVSKKRPNAQRKKDMLKALRARLGIVSPALEIADICHHSHYDWINPERPVYDSDYAKAVAEIMDAQVDFVESKLFQNVDKGDTAAQIFYLKCKGKKRGYIERQEIAIGNIDDKKFGVDISPQLIELSLKEIYDKENGSDNKQ